jgi:predicted DsbA family dithiol-disulfide isomerase
MNEKITVEVWADLICPWCWIGKRRFETALNQSEHKDRFEIIHRPFRLSPGAKTGPVTEMLASKYQLTKKEVAQSFKDLEALAAQEGLEYHLSKTSFGDTLDAHRLALWAGTQGVQSATVERIYRGYFSEGIDIFSQESLLKLAADAGLSGKDAKEMLKSDRFKHEVAQDEDNARRIGCQGVPFFLLSEKYAVSGAQPVETFALVIKKLTASADGKIY